MKGGSLDVTNSLRQLRQAVSATDLSGHDASSLRSLIGELRLTERSLRALGVKAARQSDALAAEGSAPDAEETLLGSGDVSGSTARKERDRSRIADAIPQAGNALDEGTIGAEHLDAISNAASWSTATPSPTAPTTTPHEKPSTANHSPTKPSADSAATP